PELAEGEHKFTAKATDSAGQDSPLTGEYAVVVDTTAPAKPAVMAADDNVGDVKGSIEAGETTDDATPTLSGKGQAGETVTIYDNGVA
ncbi:hypothetical protein, partial [Comamonas sp. NoAH]|uniref:hypothetical protein n=1 Tax=Comamonas halotolerans TaxID=3041496 RepID=UPI0024E171EB